MTGAGAVVRTIGGTADSGYVSDILNDTAPLFTEADTV